MTAKQLSAHLKRIGAKGGKAGTGSAKARTTEQCRKAAAERWGKYRKNKD